MSKVASTKSAEPGARMICACFDLTWADIDVFMARADATVEGLIEETRIGTKCAACLRLRHRALRTSGSDHAGALDPVLPVPERRRIPSELTSVPTRGDPKRLHNG